LFGHSWLHPFRPVFNLLLLRLRKEICRVDTINLHGATSLIRSASYAKAKRSEQRNRLCKALQQPLARQNVINRWHQTHDVPNVFVVDGSSFVTSGPVGPTSTVGALALRCADRISQRRREWK